MKGLEIREKAGRLLLPVRVQPRAAANSVVGIQQGVLKVRLTAPPLEDRANRQLLAFLAEFFGLPSGKLAIAGGRRSRNKTVSLRGLSKDELIQKLTQYLV